jgi:hypothetical protein
MTIKTIKLGEGIFLFKNVLSDTESVYKYILESKNNNDFYFKWETWPVWGNKASCYPTVYKTNDQDSSTGAKLQKECVDVFFETLKIYKQNFLDEKYFDSFLYDKKLPESYKEFKSREHKNEDYILEDFVIFEANSNKDENWHMVPHVDMFPWWGDNGITFNFNIYVNSDYDGGEIVFCKNKIESGSEDITMQDIAIYKPEAGDALLIQADCWHGVLPMKNNTSKYYIRQILTAAEKPEKKKYIKELGSDYIEFFEKEKKKNQDETMDSVLTKMYAIMENYQYKVQ